MGGSTITPPGTNLPLPAVDSLPGVTAPPQQGTSPSVGGVSQEAAAQFMASHGGEKGALAALERILGSGKGGSGVAALTRSAGGNESSSNANTAGRSASSVIAQQKTSTGNGSGEAGSRGIAGQTLKSPSSLFTEGRTSAHASTDSPSPRVVDNSRSGQSVGRVNDNRPADVSANGNATRLTRVNSQDGQFGKNGATDSVLGKSSQGGSLSRPQDGNVRLASLPARDGGVPQSFSAKLLGNIGLDPGYVKASKIVTPQSRSFDAAPQSLNRQPGVTRESRGRENSERLPVGDRQSGFVQEARSQVRLFGGETGKQSIDLRKDIPSGKFVESGKIKDSKDGELNRLAERGFGASEKTLKKDKLEKDTDIEKLVEEQRERQGQPGKQQQGSSHSSDGENEEGNVVGKVGSKKSNSNIDEPVAAAVPYEIKTFSVGKSEGAAKLDVVTNEKSTGQIKMTDWLSSVLRDPVAAFDPVALSRVQWNSGGSFTESLLGISGSLLLPLEQALARSPENAQLAGAVKLMRAFVEFVGQLNEKDLLDESKLQEFNKFIEVQLQLFVSGLVTENSSSSNESVGSIGTRRSALSTGQSIEDEAEEARRVSFQLLQMIRTGTERQLDRIDEKVNEKLGWLKHAPWIAALVGAILTVVATVFTWGSATAGVAAGTISVTTALVAKVAAVVAVVAAAVGIVLGAADTATMSVRYEASQARAAIKGLNVANTVVGVVASLISGIIGALAEIPKTVVVTVTKELVLSVISTVVSAIAGGISAVSQGIEANRARLDYEQNDPSSFVRSYLGKDVIADERTERLELEKDREEDSESSVSSSSRSITLSEEYSESESESESEIGISTQSQTQVSSTSSGSTGKDKDLSLEERYIDPDKIAARLKRIPTVRQNGIVPLQSPYVLRGLPFLPNQITQFVNIDGEFEGEEGQLGGVEGLEEVGVAEEEIIVEEELATTEEVEEEVDLPDVDTENNEKDAEEVAKRNAAKLSKTKEEEEAEEVKNDIEVEKVKEEKEKDKEKEEKDKKERRDLVDQQRIERDEKRKEELTQDKNTKEEGDQDQEHHQEQYFEEVVEEALEEAEIVS